MTSVRRVVTGEVDGKAIFVGDDMVDGAAPLALGGAEMHFMWGSDDTPVVPDAGDSKPHAGWFPRAGGYRFVIFSFPPDAEAETHPGHPDPEAGMAEVEAAFPGLLQHMDASEPGMHASDTADLEIVLSGHITLELSDGATKTLGPGDTLIQNGTRHRWSVPGDVPAVLAGVFIGAHRDDSA